MTLFKQLLENRSGRDFIIGDLHGSRPLLEKILQKHDFSPVQDRVICVGDLINRGDDSLGTLRLLEEPWFFSVAGNHERMLAELRQPLIERVLSDAQQNQLELYGAQWLLDYYEELNEDKWADLITEVFNLISQLPLLIQVGNGPDAIGVVHAQLPMRNWDQNLARLERVKKLAYWQRVPDDSLFDCLLTGRETIRQIQKNPDKEHAVAGIDWVFSGHTIVERPIRAGNQLWLDTGAYNKEQGHGFTLVEVGKTLAVTTYFHDLRVRTERFVRHQHRFQPVLDASLNG